MSGMREGRARLGAEATFSCDKGKTSLAHFTFLPISAPIVPLAPLINGHIPLSLSSRDYLSKGRAWQ
jgi:hypothetical protein